MEKQKQPIFSFFPEIIKILSILVFIGLIEAIGWWIAYQPPSNSLENLGNIAAASIDARLVDNPEYRANLLKKLSGFDIVDLQISEVLPNLQKVIERDPYYIYQNGTLQIFFLKDPILQRLRSENIKITLLFGLFFLLPLTLIFFIILRSYILPSRRLTQLIWRQISEENIHPITPQKDIIGRRITASYNFLIQSIAKKQNTISSLLFRTQENISSLNPLVSKRESMLTDIMSSQQEIMTELTDLQEILGEIDIEQQMSQKIISRIMKNMNDMMVLSKEFKDNTHDITKNAMQIAAHKDKNEMYYTNTQHQLQQSREVLQNIKSFLSKISATSSEAMVLLEELRNSANQLNLMAVNTAISASRTDSSETSALSNETQNLSQKILEKTKETIEKLVRQGNYIAISEEKNLLAEKRWDEIGKKVSALQDNSVETFLHNESFNHIITKMTSTTEAIAGNSSSNHQLIHDLKANKQETLQNKTLSLIQLLQKKSSDLLNDIELQLSGRNAINAILESTSEVIALVVQMHSDIKVSSNGSAPHSNDTN